MWYEKTQKLVESGKLTVIGIVQEQHPDRCRLFMQWKKLNWPILHDPLNLVGIPVVPMPVAIDEHGVVRFIRPDMDRLEEDFVNKKWPPLGIRHNFKRVKLPTTAEASEHAKSENSFESWRELGDILVLRDQFGGAIDAYQKALTLKSNDAECRFRMGVAYRGRFDSSARRDGDFQNAIDAWRAALEINPNHYIYRRRIQQYGPLLDKPYAFFDWISEARRDIAKRGEKPVALATEPIGAEIAGRNGDAPAANASMPAGDPSGRIHRDTGLISLTTAVVFGSDDKSRSAGAVHLVLRPNATKKAHWNNETEPLRAFIENGDVFGAPAMVEFRDAPKSAASDEERTLTINVTLSLRAAASQPVAKGAKADHSPADNTLRGYLLYNVCEGADGQCLYLRQDFTVMVPPAAKEK